MTYLGKPKFHHPAIEVNALGLTHRDYEGSVSTLCAGCGHDSISAAIIRACFELDLQPHRIAKLSGIGCSSKTPTYMLGQSHGFNSVHGRMPSVLTGASLGQPRIALSRRFRRRRHRLDRARPVRARDAAWRRHDLHHGKQRRLRADEGAILRDVGYGIEEQEGRRKSRCPDRSRRHGPAIGATFVARGFSGDKGQLVPLIKAAFEHRGAAFIDVVSPCVAFNNHEGSTKSFDYVREHNIALNSLDFITGRRPIEIDAQAGVSETVTLHDGSAIRLHRLAEDYDWRDRSAASAMLERHRGEGNLVTGLIYMNEEPMNLHQRLGTSQTPLNEMSEVDLCPGSKALDAINQSLR